MTLADFIKMDHVIPICPFTVQILLNGDYKLKEGGLVDEYKATRMDFHWGLGDRNGSEHRINGTQFPMEVRFHIAR